MVQRPHDQSDVETGIGGGQAPGIAHLGGETAHRSRLGSGLRDVRRDEIHDVHVVAVVRQPAGMDSGGAPDVENPGGPVGQVSAQNLLGAQQLEATQALGEPPTFVGGLVVLDDLGRDLGGDLGHGRGSYCWPNCAAHRSTGTSVHDVPLHRLRATHDRPSQYACSLRCSGSTCQPTSGDGGAAVSRSARCGGTMGMPGVTSAMPDTADVPDLARVDLLDLPDPARVDLPARLDLLDLPDLARLDLPDRLDRDREVLELDLDPLNRRNPRLARFGGR